MEKINSAAMTDTSAAKSVLAYLDIEQTDKRLERIMQIFNQYAERVQVREKVVTKIHRHYEKVYCKVYIPTINLEYIPKKNLNAWCTMGDIAKFVCEKHGITPEQLKRNSPDSFYGNDYTGLGRKLAKRSNILVNARQEFVKIARLNHSTMLSYDAIANFLGYNEHSSIIHLWKDRKTA